VNSPAEKLLQRFGIREPSEIDLEAIAYELGALVVFDELDGCDARIVAHANNAIITVNSKSSRERQRFSVGHELGHWKEGWRGRGFLCAKDDIRESYALANAVKDAETRANRFSADLILPDYIFVPACLHKPLTIDTAQTLSQDFQASITATAIRLVKKGSYPGMAVCYSSGKREWFVPSDGLPDWFMPLQELHQDTDAFELLYTEGWGKTSVVTTEGSSWIDRRDAGNFRLKEQSIKVAKDRVLSLLWFLNLP